MFRILFYIFFLKTLFKYIHLIVYVLNFMSGHPLIMLLLSAQLAPYHIALCIPQHRGMYQGVHLWCWTDHIESFNPVINIIWSQINIPGNSRFLLKLCDVPNTWTPWPIFCKLTGFVRGEMVQVSSHKTLHHFRRRATMDCDCDRSLSLEQKL